MASVRLKSPLRLTPDAKALSFELSCAVALSSLIGRMPGERLTSAAEAKVPLSLWQSAAADARMRSLGGIFGARGGAGFALRFRICETNRLPILETYRQSATESASLVYALLFAQILSAPRRSGPACCVAARPEGQGGAARRPRAVDVLEFYKPSP